MKAKHRLKLKVTRKPNKIIGDISRVITRPHLPDDSHRISRIIGRIMDLPDAFANDLMAKILKDFSGRHEDLHHVFEKHLDRVRDFLPEHVLLKDVQKELIGAYFTKEYAIESAALFNPSIVLHPDQTHLEKGSLRFVMSLRATGEGHISSIVFRSGILDRHNTFRFDPVSEFVETPDLKQDSVYNRSVFQRKLDEMKANNEISTYILGRLPEEFLFKELIEQIRILNANPQFSPAKQKTTFGFMTWLADSNYEVDFHSDHRISERVIFPVSRNESRGIEDARFVQFFDDNQEAPITPPIRFYNGVTILPSVDRNKGFHSFQNSDTQRQWSRTRVRPFPRKIKVNMPCFPPVEAKTTISCFQTTCISGRSPK